MGNYDLFKQALLLKFELIPKVYRNRFWGVRKTPSVTYKEVTNLLWEYLRKWGKGTGATTSEDMCNLVGLKQLYDICSPDLKMWLVDPKHWALADEFVDSRSGGGAAKETDIGDSEGWVTQRPLKVATPRSPTQGCP